MGREDKRKRLGDDCVRSGRSELYRRWDWMMRGGNEIDKGVGCKWGVK